MNNTNLNNLSQPEIKLYKYDKSKHHVNMNDFNSIITYVINHYEKFLLLLLIFVLIYVIDHITNINAMLYGATQIPVLGASSSASKPEKTKNKKGKK